MKSEEIFTKYYKRMKTEGILKASFISLLVFLSLTMISGIICWFFGINIFWIFVLSAFIISFALFFPIYNYRYKPTMRKIAERVDDLGLEQRVITMVELRGDDSYIARRQYEDTKTQLEKVSAALIKFAVSLPLIISLIIAGVCVSGSTTVYALYEKGVIKSGIELINTDIEVEKYYKIEYKTGKEGGSIIGETSQIVYENENALAVMAVPDYGYQFCQWSDGRDDPYRIDYNINKSFTVSAIFIKVDLYDPDNDNDNNPFPDDLPLIGDNEEGKDGPPKPNTNPSTDGNGKYNENNKYLDGEHDYKDGLDDAKNDAKDRVNNDKNISSDDREIIDNYFDGISN